jgi:predicted transcriptional regulator
MSQLTLRIPDQLAVRLKVAARACGQSVSQWATKALTAAVTLPPADTEAQVARERLTRAGLLVEVSARRRRRPSRRAVARARAAAARGRPLSEIVAEARR